MRRGTLVILLFVLVAGAIIAASTLLQNQPPIEITVATDPLAETWVRDAASAFNNSGATIGVGRRIRVNVVVQSDSSLLTNPWTTATHPDAWVPAWSAVASIVRSTGVTAQTVSSSLARTPIIWMSYDRHTDDIPDVSWQGIAEAAATNNTINLAFSPPNASVQGLGVLISAAAEYHQTGILTDALLSNAGFRAWLTPVIKSVPNFNSIGGDAARFVAGPQGATFDAAMAPESQWLNALATLRERGTPRFGYPSLPVVLDFPFLTLRSTNTTDEKISAAQAFAAYLSGAAQQARLETFGLRPAQGEPSENAALFNAGEQFGILPVLPTVQQVQLPSTSGVAALNQWFQNSIR